MLPPFDVPDIVILSRQRSGTHLLASALASHPNIRSRGECFLRYLRLLTANQPIFDSSDMDSLTNHVGIINVGILMYNAVPYFEKRYCLIDRMKIIHLVRDPISIARSLAQKAANQDHYGQSYSAHVPVGGSILPHVRPGSCAEETLALSIGEEQRHYRDRVALCQRAITVSYESITNGGEISVLPEPIASSLLSFIGVHQHALATTLARTGLWQDSS